MPPVRSLRLKKGTRNAPTTAPEISVPGAESSSDILTETKCTPSSDSSKKTANPLSFSTPQPFVTLTIGPEGLTQKFVVHKALITHFSPVFSAAFNSEFIEGQSQSMTFTDIEAKPFGLLVHWCYQKEIEGGVNVDIVQLAKLWLLGERFLIPKLQNEAMDLIYEMIECISPLQMQHLVTLIYESKVDLPLKNLVLQRFIRLPPSNLQQWFNFFPDGMLVDVAVALANHINRLPAGHKVVKGGVEEYHVEERCAVVD